MVTIRSAYSSDLATINNFQVKMAFETENLILDPVVVNEGVKAVFTDPSKGEYYVAQLDDKVIASLLITHEWSDWRNAWVWWIQSVYVRPEYRRTGVFAQMYQFLQDTVEQTDQVKGIRLYVDKTNERAQKVYRKLGMNSDHYELFESLK